MRCYSLAMEKFMWFLATIVACAAVGYALGYVYLQKNPNTDTAQSIGGAYSEIIQSAQSKDEHTELLFTVGGAFVGSLLGVIKVKGGRIN